MIRTAILCKLFDICLDKMFDGILAATFSPTNLTGRLFPELVIKVDGRNDYPPCYGWEVGETIDNPDKDYNDNWGRGTCIFSNALVNFVDEDGDLFVTATDMCFRITFIRDDAAIKYEQFCRVDADEIKFKKVIRTNNTVEIWLKDWHVDGYYVNQTDIVSPDIND